MEEGIGVIALVGRAGKSLHKFVGRGSQDRSRAGLSWRWLIRVGRLRFPGLALTRILTGGQEPVGYLMSATAELALLSSATPNMQYRDPRPTAHCCLLTI